MREPVAQGDGWKLYREGVVTGVVNTNSEDYERYLDARSKYHGCNREHLNYGDEISGSRWFRGTPNVVDGIWKCPIPDCLNPMAFNGRIWPVGDPGHHYTCTVCGFTAALPESELLNQRIKS